MNAKHTPGPWLCDSHNKAWIYAEKDGKDILNYNQRSIETVDANAQLIAAAPDLLEAAETVIARVDHTNIHTTIAEMGDTWNMLRAAIALTRGAE